MKKYAALLLTEKKGRVMLCLLATSVFPAAIFVKSLSKYNFTYIIYHKTSWFSILF